MIVTDGGIVYNQTGRSESILFARFEPGNCLRMKFSENQPFLL